MQRSFVWIGPHLFIIQHTEGILILFPVPAFLSSRKTPGGGSRSRDAAQRRPGAVRRCAGGTSARLKFFAKLSFKKAEKQKKRQGRLSKGMAMVKAVQANW